jgi:uncharacterized LabA/DUF88 family protein
MDRCALFVDASYVLADGAMAVHGTRRRESVSWDYPGLLQLFGNLAMERTRLPLLRCYWYDATVEGRRSAEHDALADLPGVKLRVAKMRPGRLEGVEREIHRDLTTLARNKAVSDVMLVSVEEDLARVVADVQDMGMRVSLLQISGDGGSDAARSLRQECDDVIEVGAAHLRPYVELISGAEPPRADEVDGAAALLTPVSGNGGSGTGASGNGQRGAGYQRVTEAPAGDEAAHPVPQPVPADFAQPEPGQPERPEFVAMDYAPARDYAPAVELAPAADYAASLDYSASADYGRPAEYSPVLTGPVALSSGPGPREDRYAAPAAAAATGDEAAADFDRMPADGLRGADLPGYGPGVRDGYQRDGGYRDPVAADLSDRLQPVPVAFPGGASAQVRRLPVPSHAVGQHAAAPPSIPGGQLNVGQPTGAQPAVPADPNAVGYGTRGAASGGLRPVQSAPGGPSGFAGTGPDGTQGQGFGPAGPGSQPPPPPSPGGQPDMGSAGPNGTTGPLGLVSPGGYSPGLPGASLGDAVQSAHEEGQAFGDSVARDAPALWLEAVLARKPRMPSDLEARLLQGSTLPIDFLLHDEVRHALRRGFWDALERARR